MDCPEYQRQVSLLIDGELDEIKGQVLKEHIAVCGDCGNFFERVRIAKARLRSAPKPRLRADLAQRVKETIAREGADRAQTNVFPVWVQVPLFAALVLAAVGLGNLAGRSLSDLFIGDAHEQTLEVLAPVPDPSIAEVLIDLGNQENS